MQSVVTGDAAANSRVSLSLIGLVGVIATGERNTVSYVVALRGATVAAHQTHEPGDELSGNGKKGPLSFFDLTRCSGTGTECSPRWPRRRTVALPRRVSQRDRDSPQIGKRLSGLDSTENGGPRKLN